VKSFWILDFGFWIESPRRQPLWALTAIFLASFVAFPASACNTGSVRDAGFQTKRDVHRLCVFTNASDAEGEAIFGRLRSWLDGDGKYLNVALDRVDGNDGSVHWENYGIPSKPPSVPVVALVGLMPASPRRAFVIGHWEPTLNDSDLAALLTSPAREALKRAITDVWAVVLYSPGANAEEKKEPLLKSVSEKWATDHPPGISIVSFDRNDPRERLLCLFAGLKPSGPDWAGVVFGRGKLMAPPMEGGNITENNLNQLLNGLTVPCTCLQQSMTLGLDLPMTWEPEFDAKAAGAVQSLGYTETVVGAEAPEDPAAALMAEIPREDRHVLASVLLPLGCASGIAVAAVVWIVWRNRRRRAASLEE